MARRHKKITTGFSAPKVKILRQFNPFAYKSTQGGPAHRFGQAIDKSKHDPSMLVGKTTKKRGVRRLHVNDPYNMNSVTGIAATGATQATFSPEADQFTNNPNPKYDPSKAPPANVPEFTTRDVSSEKPGKASRGHQNIVKRTLFNQNAGKRLKRL